MSPSNSRTSQQTQFTSKNYATSDRLKARRQTFKRIRRISSNSSNLVNIPESDVPNLVVKLARKGYVRSKSDQPENHTLEWDNSSRNISPSLSPKICAISSVPKNSSKRRTSDFLAPPPPPRFTLGSRNNSLNDSKNESGEMEFPAAHLSHSAFIVSQTEYPHSIYDSQNDCSNLLSRSQNSSRNKLGIGSTSWVSFCTPSYCNEPRSVSRYAVYERSSLDVSKHAFYLTSAEVTKAMAPKRFKTLLSKMPPVTTMTNLHFKASSGDEDKRWRASCSELGNYSAQPKFSITNFDDELKTNKWKNDLFYQNSLVAGYGNCVTEICGGADLDDESSANRLTFPPADFGARKRRSFMRKNRQQEESIDNDMNTRHATIAHRTKIADWSVVLATGGIVAMMITEEFSAWRLLDNLPVMESLLRAIVMLSSLALVILVIAYYVLSTKLLMLDYGAEDWRVTVTAKQVLLACAECFVCAITPVPLSSVKGHQNAYQFYRNPANGSTGSSVFKLSKGIRLFNNETNLSAADLLDKYEGVHYAGSRQLLSVLMFLKCYLVFRCLVLHSKQYKDTATRSVAALNNVSVNVSFVIRSLLTENPFGIVVLFTALLWLIISWCFTHCERHFMPPQVAHLAYLQSLYVVGITFLTVGYGDVVPRSICGRVLATFTGITGLFAASVLIATVQNALALSSSELHINNFMAETGNQKQKRNAAARIIQQTWHIHQCHLSTDDRQLVKRQRKFVEALFEFRKIKHRQRLISEENSDLLGLEQVHTMIQSQMKDYQTNQEALLESVDDLRARTISVSHTLELYLQRLAIR